MIDLWDVLVQYLKNYYQIYLPSSFIQPLFPVNHVESQIVC